MPAITCILILTVAIRFHSPDDAQVRSATNIHDCISRISPGNFSQLFAGPERQMWSAPAMPAPLPPLVVQLDESASIEGRQESAHAVEHDDKNPTQKPPRMLTSPFKAEEAKAAQQRWAAFLHKPVELKSSIGLRLVLIPPGKFLMGSGPDAVRPPDDEKAVNVELTFPFYIGKFEVTQSQYKKVMGHNPSAFLGGPAEGPRKDTSELPVELVSWRDANTFCRKLNELEQQAGTLPEGWKYSLPTEAQWEYACRAGTTTETAFGDDMTSHHANFDGSMPLNNGEKGPFLELTTKVGSYPANQFGLHDMHGNVGEYCLDVYIKEVPGGVNPLVNPILLFPKEYVEKGGNWFASGRRARSASRVPTAPEDVAIMTGFRVVLKPTTLKALVPARVQ